MFLTKAVSMNGFPFEVKKTTTDPYVTLTEDEILRKLEVSIASNPLSAIYTGPTA